MKVNVAGVWYDANEQPIAVELNQADKTNIANMFPEASKYISYPDNMSFAEVMVKLNIKKEPIKSKISEERKLELKTLVYEWNEKTFGHTQYASDKADEMYNALINNFG